MNRRKFLTSGGLFGLVGALASEFKHSADDEQIPRFEDGSLLTSQQLNRIVDELNRLKVK